MLRYSASCSPCMGPKPWCARTEPRRCGHLRRRLRHLRRHPDGRPDAGNEWVRSHQSHPQHGAAGRRVIPIIAMTANAFAEDVKAAMEAGMTAHVAKPIDVGDTAGSLRNVLNGSRKGRD